MGCTNRTNGKRAGGLPVIRHRNQPSLRLISLSKAEISILVSLTVLPERLSSQVKFQMLCLPVYPLTLQNLKIPFLGSFCIQKQSACSILVLHLRLFHALIFHRIHHAIQSKRIIMIATFFSSSYSLPDRSPSLKALFYLRLHIHIQPGAVQIRISTVKHFLCGH